MLCTDHMYTWPRSYSQIKQKYNLALGNGDGESGDMHPINAY